LKTGLCLTPIEKMLKAFTQNEKIAIVLENKISYKTLRG
jgi:hypothetical protein